MSHVDIGSWFSKLQQATNSFTNDERVAWIDIEGVSLCVWSHNTFVRMSSKWGEFVYDEDNQSPYYHRKRICIKITWKENIYESFKIIVKGKVFRIRAKEVTRWTPNFNEIEEAHTDFDEESLEGKNDGFQKNATSEVDSKAEERPETIFEEGEIGAFKANSFKENHKDEIEDLKFVVPFNIYELLNKKRSVTKEAYQSEGELNYPSRFTHCDASEVNSNMVKNHVGNVNTRNQKYQDMVKETSDKLKDLKENPKEDVEFSSCLGHFKGVDTPKSGGSILQLVDDLIKIRTWVKDYKNKYLNHKKSLKNGLADIDSILDKGEGTSDILEERMNIMKKIKVLENIDSLELAQKAKEEIKGVVWDCGLNKSPGPDGFTFGVYQRYWCDFEPDVVDAVNHFFKHGLCHRRGNSSFIALISKTLDAKLVKDFRPISLIGSLYKIIDKILANRLVSVMDDLVNELQYAFIANRQILDGPFILNELIQWCKVKNKETMIFKVDFEKAFDSVCCDFLDDVLKHFDFGDRWCSWIHSCLTSSRGSILVNGSPTIEFQFHKGLK
uniref:RNA-directed DNA polymerase, eukaryota, reverse transcriptase zinc-binding domain protein n=1 Tax=Tanacetum cinerariifolium TaxID=118510 RepID=A0A699JKD2_TANCI|nr:RNA-directed DNA polymerase, eukaryota, reverse transcriptase zinc-binding domain protein [Tanacetum cinerariifolium]